jgi:sulfatase maturation enzyme AslB (radical SAM superfamily)
MERVGKGTLSTPPRQADKRLVAYPLSLPALTDMSTELHGQNSAPANRQAQAPLISLDWFNIEFASRCNLRCKWCSLDFDKPSVNMDEALLAKALDELLTPAGWAVGEIALHNGGEALMHPRLSSMLGVIAAKRAGHATFPRVSLLTNGVLLNQAKSNAILSSGAIDRLRVSVDGGSVAAFEEIRTPARWSRVRDNVFEFVKLNNAAPRRIDTGVICVVPPDRPLTIDWMEEEFRDVLLAVDSYELRHPHNWDGSKELGLTPKPDAAPAMPVQLYGMGRSLLRRARNVVAPRPASEHPVCKFLLRELVLLPDGRVSVCCADLNARGVIGQLGETSLRDIFDSQARASMIDAFRKGNKASIPLCRDCVGYYD